MVIDTYDLSVKIGNIKMKTPIMTTSGTSGSSDEIAKLVKQKDVSNSLGAFVTKGVTLQPKSGNPEPRIVETHSGILNSIGLQNSGAESFIYTELPKILTYELPIIVNISAESIEKFGKLAAYIDENDRNNLINGIEINVSCPNVSEGGIAFGTDPKLVEQIVRIVRDNVDERITVITKLTPNITDITEPARAAIQGGTHALSMINTLKGMAIDIELEKPFFVNKHGGLSGPAIKPVGVYMVYKCFKEIKECNDGRIPIIGIGGISNYRDAFEYIMAGATAIGIGTEWFANTDVFEQIYNGMKSFLKKKNKTLSSLMGIAHKECN